MNTHKAWQENKNVRQRQEFQEVFWEGFFAEKPLSWGMNGMSEYIMNGSEKKLYSQRKQKLQQTGQ